MDDVGAASKRYEVHGLTRLRVGRWRVPFPGNFLWLKYVPPIKRWGPYPELTAAQWEQILAALQARGARLTAAITAAWVEGDGRLTPFPRKFPDAARVVRAGVEAGLLEVANHGLTHCLLRGGAWRPRAFAGNRTAHREFYEFLPAREQEDHLARAQAILQDLLGVPVVTFVPPGNLLQEATLEAARRCGLRFASYRAPTRLDGPLPVIGDEWGIAFHDRDLALGGVARLGAMLEAAAGRPVLAVRDLAERLLAGRPSPAR
jgi:peptidoglycan/xylan/chitin deacetylase (PgdA/CDA1 family)